MARRKRPYVPKVKGCYECSQRRIDCDGTRPGCQKCASRGLECSGFDVKFRFRDGHPPVNGVAKAKRNAGTLLLSSNNVYSSFRGDTNRVLRAIDDESDPQGSDSTLSDRHKQVLDWKASLSPIPGSPNSSSSGSDIAVDEHTQETTHDESIAQARYAVDSTTAVVPRSAPFQLEPWKEYLLTYFSNNIAPEMVVMDDDHNGWRHLVLPMACTDDLILSAVLSASAFHLASRGANENVVDPQKLYSRAIRELQQRRDLIDCDHKTKQAVILAIGILLVAVMINGCSDFPIIFQMLESALNAVGGESGFLDGGEAANFFLRQIRKMRVYAAPLLSQDAGLHAIIYHGQDSFDCLHYYDQLHPTQSPTFKVIADLRQQAFDIYLDRVLGGGSTTASKGVMDRFIATIQSFSEGSLGENVLVWPVFIAASESCSMEHQAIFEQFLRRQYQRNGFGNILRALEMLKTIWSRKSNNDWPAMLPEPQVFIM